MATYGPASIEDINGNPAPGATFTLHAQADTDGLAPLPAFDLNTGNPINPIKANGKGRAAAVDVPATDEPWLWAKSSDPTIPMQPVISLDALTRIQEAARASEAAAQDAATEAAAARESAEARSVPVTSTPGLVLTQMSDEPGDYGWAAPQGSSGGGSGVIVLASADEPVPPGTPPGSIIAFTGDNPVTPAMFDIPTGTGDVTTTGSASSSGNTSIDVPVPANAAVGDLLVLVVALQSSSGSPLTAPAGWRTAISVTGTQQARVWGVYLYPVTDAAALNNLGATVSVAPPVTTGRHAAAMLRVTRADLTHDHAYAPGSNHAPYELPASGADTITFEQFTSTFPAAGLLALVWCNTSAGVPTSDATADGWTKAARAVGYDAGGGGSELVLLWQPATGTTHARATFTIDPPTTGGPKGTVLALKASS